jgi:ribosome-binding factor A
MVYRYTKAPTSRQLKIGQAIRQALSEVFSKNELSHPFFEKLMVTVSEVRVGPDMKVATAFLILPDNSDQKAIIKFFNEIAPAIRKLITPKINLRFSPEIRFVYDESIKRAADLEEVFKKLKK